ncbi:hypothetical protein AR158_c229L [Paramecium bursaria Chlorella virus AR158]|uniref:hypothetical protein n=1 Tax=Paramecium bursaria Chlorella virus AR158 TaxID=380598 RepID=UPI00015AA87F|nr:hypothetical protein AR158_c229L [Paramecium bursaria Chlorella virus AR158]ABU43775.1 hypothetical protein AR158_c229L [Paramecium bursaria Chlorella virus AR158]
MKRFVRAALHDSGVSKRKKGVNFALTHIVFPSIVLPKMLILKYGSPLSGSTSSERQSVGKNVSSVICL